MITNKQRVRVGLRVVWFNTVERWHDFVNVALPVFLMSGLIVACFRFWLWLFGVM